MHDFKLKKCFSGCILIDFFYNNCVINVSVMDDLRQFAEQLVNLTVKEFVELSKILVDEYGGDIGSNFVFYNNESKPDYFIPRKFKINNPYVNRRYLLFSHRKII